MKLHRCTEGTPSRKIFKQTEFDDKKMLGNNFSSRLAIWMMAGKTTVK